MPSSARAMFTRLLPWAALGLMTLAFLLQVRERRRLEGELGRRPAAARIAPMPAPRSAAAAPVIETTSHDRRALEEALDAARAETSQARAQGRALQEHCDRLEALRATEQARADALDSERKDRDAAAQARVQALEHALEQAQAEARAGVARREGPVARWLELARRGDAQGRAAMRREAAEATTEDVEALRAAWRPGVDTAPPGVVAMVLGAMPASEAAAILAADLMLAPGDSRAPWALIEALGAHAIHPSTLEIVLRRGHAGAREGALAAARVARARWDESATRRVRAALLALLESEDEATLEFALGGLRKLELGQYAGRVLPFLDHSAAGVRIAAVYALLAVSEQEHALRTLTPYVAALLADAQPDVRMAALFLAQELAGEKRSLAFGSSDEAVAAEIQRLKARLTALAGE